MTIQKKDTPLKVPGEILVIEDNTELNRIMQKTLQRDGFKTSGVFNGSDAITWIASNNNAIIIVD